MMIIYWTFLVSLLLRVLISDARNCNSFVTCSQCIGNNYGCVWCSNDSHNGSRCESKQKIQSTWCPVPLENPTLKIDLIATENNEEDNLQFKPKRLNIAVRPGDQVTFQMAYKPAKDFPLDVYYLMDNSYTMKEHKENLKNQAQTVYDRMTALTNNVQLGVGSFVEKLSFPYASPVYHQAYVFQNHLSLTDNVTQFIQTVDGISEVGNYDDPEATLDALMQAMVCFDELMWRPKARRFIVVSTDSTYHSAGDGKMAGAWKPNDMKCHLKDINVASLIYDYPSVYQILKVAKEKEINILFAVLKDVKPVYDILSEKLGSACVELKKSSNIADMIEAAYLSLVQNVSLTHDAPAHIDLTFDPPCTRAEPCSYKHKENMTIEAKLNVKKCLVNKDNQVVFKIGPSGLDEKLTVTVKTHCECDCERDGKGLVNSKKCNKAGTYQCGICKCNPNRYGDLCECSGSSSKELDILKCKENKNDTKVCSGHGDCRCGKCENCDPYFGNYCESNINKCKFYENKPCGGNGKCTNNGCQCSQGYSGEDCSCPTDSASCIGPYSKICSENGYCSCGECKCNATDSKGKLYSGKYCNFCEDCNMERCKELERYVECIYTNKTDCQITDSSAYDATFVNKTEIAAQEYRNYFKCSKAIDSGIVVFKYLDDDESTKLLIQKETEMAPKANVWITIGSIVGSILLIGLLTLIAWKIMVDIHDAREYKRFSEKAAAEGYNVTRNPLYQAPATVINNPTYNDRS